MYPQHFLKKYNRDDVVGILLISNTEDHSGIVRYLRMLYLMLACSTPGLSNLNQRRAHTCQSGLKVGRVKQD